MPPLLTNAFLTGMTAIMLYVFARVLADLYRPKPNPESPFGYFEGEDMPEYFQGRAIDGRRVVAVQVNAKTLDFTVKLSDGKKISLDANMCEAMWSK